MSACFVCGTIGMVPVMSKTRDIEIFRPGQHTSMAGDTINFTIADVEAMASGYDRELFDAPAVVGHPVQDGPAYAWCEKLAFKDGKLVATINDIDPAFADLVTAKRFKKISAAFYAPDDANNPKPGTYYLRHIGFLGAAAPAVKGLKSAAFADDASKVLEFAEVSDMSWPLSNIATTLRGIRDWIIGEKGLDVANQVVPDWNITSIEDAATQLRTPPQPAYIEHLNPEKPNVKTQAQIDLEAREAALAARESDVTARELSFTEAEVANRRAADRALVEALEADGRVVPSIKTDLLNFMAQLDAGKALAFAEGDTAPKLTTHAFFCDLLKNKTGKVITFAEVSKPGTEAEAPADAEAHAQQIVSKALAFVEEQKGKGITITVGEAIDQIRTQEAQ